MKPIIFSLFMTFCIQVACLEKIANADTEMVNQLRLKVSDFLGKVTYGHKNLQSPIGRIAQSVYGLNLRGESKSRYLDLYRRWGDEFPPKAFFISADYSGLPIDLFVVTEDFDGASYLYVFYSNGDNLDRFVLGLNGELLR